MESGVELQWNWIPLWACLRQIKQLSEVHAGICIESSNALPPWCPIWFTLRISTSPRNWSVARESRKREFSRSAYSLVPMLR